jgi:hypothetical protein
VMRRLYSGERRAGDRFSPADKLAQSSP